MNERVKEFAEQARKHFPKTETSGEFWVFDEQKFAELIVRECIKALWTQECHTSDLAVEEYNRNSKKIKEHFGVEE